MKQVTIKMNDPNGWVLDGKAIALGQVLTVSESTYKVSVEAGVKLEIINKEIKEK